jgi:hypothetical protein
MPKVKGDLISGCFWLASTDRHAIGWRLLTTQSSRRALLMFNYTAPNG